VEACRELGAEDHGHIVQRLFLYRTVRIDLDEVETLGSFIELEAVAARGSDLTAEHRLIREPRRTLAITDERLVVESYSELVLGL